MEEKKHTRKLKNKGKGSTLEEKLRNLGEKKLCNFEM